MRHQNQSGVPAEPEVGDPAELTTDAAMDRRPHGRRSCFGLTNRASPQHLEPARRANIAGPPGTISEVETEPRAIPATSAGVPVDRLVRRGELVRRIGEAPRQHAWRRLRPGHPRQPATEQTWDGTGLPPVGFGCRRGQSVGPWPISLARCGNGLPRPDGCDPAHSRFVRRMPSRKRVHVGPLPKPSVETPLSETENRCCCDKL